jgi:hypothetical protein
VTDLPTFRLYNLHLAVGSLLRNQNLLPEEKAALSEALYCALKDFISGSNHIPPLISANADRIFEVVRRFSNQSSVSG